MALPILDGNQSATTLSTIFTAGAHIPAHTVVSLGSQAISDIGSAVSGISVSIGGTQSVTGSVSVLNFPSTQTIAGTVTVGASSVTFNSNVAKRPDGSWQPLSVEAGSGYVSARVYQSDITPFLATVTVGNSVTIGSIPAISGTVTANLSKLVSHASTITKSDNQVQIIGGYSGGSPTNATAYPLGVESTGYINSNLRWGGTGVLVDTGASALPVQGTVTIGNSVTIGSLPSISGTVTANVNVVSIPLSAFPDTWITGGDTLKVDINTIDTSSPATWLQQGGGDVPISGTVTAAAPNGSLTTRFGTPTTANTAFATSAVTNANRKYLLIQNVTTGSNVITVGIGFTPTTTQGIQLTAGAGITFESSYIPTGAVYVLSSVTASNFTILEA